MVSGFLNVSLSPKTNYFYLWRPQDASNNSRKPNDPKTHSFYKFQNVGNLTNLQFSKCSKDSNLKNFKFKKTSKFQNFTISKISKSQKFKINLIISQFQNFKI